MLEEDGENEIDLRLDVVTVELQKLGEKHLHYLKG